MINPYSQQTPGGMPPRNDFSAGGIMPGSTPASLPPQPMGAGAPGAGAPPMSDFFASGGATSGGGQQPGGFQWGGDTYSNYMQEAMRRLEEEEKTGRGDLSKYYQEAQGYGQPYRAGGQAGLEQLLGSMGLSGPEAQKKSINAFKESPGYQFALQQGLQGTQRAQAASGLGGSGAEMRALQQTGQGIASQGFGGYQQKLAGLAGMGAGAAESAAQRASGMGSSLAGLGEFYGGASSSLMSAMGKTEVEREEAAKQRKSSIWGDIFKMFGQWGAPK